MKTLKDVKLPLRERVINDEINIGIIEMHHNGESIPNVTIPYPMTKTTGFFNNHALYVINIIKEFVPNAKFHLVENNERGLRYLIDKKCPIVNMSLSGTYAQHLEWELAKNSFLVTASGNDGADGGSDSRPEHWFHVGSVDSDLNLQNYSGHKKGKIKAVSYSGLKWNFYNGELHGTSFSAPIVTGLLAQVYCIYRKMTGAYPSIADTKTFLKANCHDILSDGWDEKSYYGLFRLPPTIEIRKIEMTHLSNDAMISTLSEKCYPTYEPIKLDTKPMIFDNRTYLPTRTIGNLFGISVSYDNKTQKSQYYKLI